MKVGFVGPRDIIFPFRSLGAEIISQEGKSISEIVKIITSEEFAIIFVIEEIYRQLEEESEITEHPEINLVPIPGLSGSRGYGKEKISELVKRAVGIEIGGLQ